MSRASHPVSAGGRPGTAGLGIRRGKPFARHLHVHADSSDTSAVSPPGGQPRAQQPNGNYLLNALIGAHKITIVGNTQRCEDI